MFCILEGVISKIEEILNFAGGIAIVIMMAVTLREVFGRYLFNAGIPGYIEIVTVMMGPIAFLGFAYTLRNRGHIRMDLLVKRVPKGRFYHGWEILLLLITLPAITVIAYFTMNFTYTSYETGSCTLYLQLVYWPFQLCVAIGYVTLLIRIVVLIIQQVIHVTRGDENKELL
jgi:TRAP-type mannitol/chloroaromatic compound transport system permease small subunit